MLDELKNRLSEYLQQYQGAALCGMGQGTMWLLPVHYRSFGLELYCAVPGWSDAAYILQETTTVQLIVPFSGQNMATERVERAARVESGAWLWYLGEARQIISLDCPTSVAVAQAVKPGSHIFVRILPRRIDLIDERRGWGARETLEI